MRTPFVIALLVLACVDTARAAYRRFGVPLPVTSAKAAGWFANQYGNWNWHTMKAGDLDGDARLEFVLVNTQWEIYAVDDLAACTTAGDPSTTLLWQINNPAGNVKAISGNQWLVDLRAWQGWHPQSFAVWDLDDDGRCEVAATWRLPDSLTYVCVFSGVDGRRLARSRVGIETGLTSAIGYNVGVANVSGDSRAHDLYCYVDETGFVYAYHYTPGDSLLTTRWSHVSNPGKTPTDLTGHQGMPYDIDGDLRDEFVANGALDHDGTVLFSFVNTHQATYTWWGTYMHADNSSAGDILPGHPGVELLIAPCDDALPAVITDPSGAILVNPRDSAFATFPHTETFNFCRFRRDIAGLQYACEPKFTSTIVVTDCSGRTIARIPVSGMQAALDWDGERSQDELLVMSEAAVGVYTARDTTYGANSFGYVGLVREVREGYHQYGYPLPIDICGDFREEVVYNSYDSIIVIQNRNANPNGPYPSPTVFDTYMKRYTQLGFGAYAYYPYSEYSGPVGVAGRHRLPPPARAEAGAGDGLHVYTLQGQRVARPCRPGAAEACGVYVYRTTMQRGSGRLLCPSTRTRPTR